jgi:tetratricopeptide (TPR) repeat protein
VQARPRRARSLAERALVAARASGDAEAEVAARYALGWAQFEIGDADAARATLRAGIRLATTRGDRRGSGLLRRQLAFQLAQSGNVRAAQREIEAAIGLLSGRDRAQSEVHRLAIHCRARAVDGQRQRRVLAEAASALRVLRRDGDAIWEARLLHNRAVLHFQRGDLDRAEADFARAHTLYEQSGAELAGVNTAAALIEIALLRGELVRALSALDELERARPEGEFGFDVEECRVLALSQARLLPEATAAAEALVDRTARMGWGDYTAPAMVDVASISLMAGDLATARRYALGAERSFAARDEPIGSALARAVLLRVRLLEGGSARSLVRSGLASAHVLEAAGWRNDGLRTRLLVARLALAQSSLATARAQLALARPLWRRGLAADRIELCRARALLLVAEGDRAGAERQVRLGLRLVDEFRGSLGAVELRATASGIGAELAMDGLRLALESRKPRKILEWAERTRGNALRLPAVRPAADPTLSRLQAELRRVSAARRPGSEAGKARLEAAIRTRSRLVSAGPSAGASAPTVAEAARLLGERALVEYVSGGDSLYALTLVDGKLALHELGSSDVTSELEWLQFSYGGLTRMPAGASRRAVAQAGADEAAGALDRLLVQPLLPAIGPAPLVIVPTGALHALPWGTLPALRGRPVVVAPSLASWVELAARPPSRRRKLAFAAGPRLRYAGAEVRELAELHGRGTPLSGKNATSAAVLAAMDGAALAHLACHGHFRADSPLFSSLELGDGRLNVYELQRLRQAPEIVILSSCDLAQSRLHPGDELLGLAAALLGMGTRTIVASLLAVPDVAAKRMMLGLHRNLRAGVGPAAALADVQARAAVPGFICLGSG